MKALHTSNVNEAIISDYQESKDLCLVPCHVTFVSRNKIKFYREFDLEQYSNLIPYLEKEALLTISKLETSLLIDKGFIEKVIWDIDRSEQIIYFDIILASEVPHTSFVELLGYLSTVFMDS
ncbi:hypothetical protein [Desulfosporosinus hippei]|uniref:Uncharacterized protein n=1 Tax=Desulfosporosinus hippei DSM 8344 TaxID=1121419 RepID=A0A1G7YRS0_9FIRM|nr:hypothetical protein [Desulfosporosinus hippei]SDG99124.1 hypothetical protein SAMN05443529_108136 [Desulfosporosinus hippei DSM 8344]